MMNEMLFFAKFIGFLGFMLAQMCRMSQQRRFVFLQLQSHREKRPMAYLRRRRAQHIGRTYALAATAVVAVINEQRHRDSPH